MRKHFLLSLFLVAAAAGQPATVTFAQVTTVPSTESKPAPYDEQLARLSEILGAVQYLRTLCPASGSEEWRKSMGDLLKAETENEPPRRQRMTAAFNRGYRSFAAIHTSCTAAAIVAEENYRNEGATLAQEIASRFGN